MEIEGLCIVDLSLGILDSCMNRTSDDISIMVTSWWIS